jgi:hypothetical protein
VKNEGIGKGGIKEGLISEFKLMGGGNFPQSLSGLFASFLGKAKVRRRHLNPLSDPNFFRNLSKGVGIRG